MTAMLASKMILVLFMTGAQYKPPTKEYLTPEEITKIQDAQEIDQRTKIYMEAAELRLKVAEERLWGKESAPGDPMEFFSVQDMLEGYYQILRSVMINLDDAFQNSRNDRGKVGKALKSLPGGTEKMLQDLEVLKKIAEEKKLEDVWNLVNDALDITRGAHEGAQLGLAGQPDSKDQKKKKP